MAFIIHFNTFFGEEAEEKKLDLLDKLESKLGISTEAKQAYENPDDESDGFDLYLKYEDEILVDYDLLSKLAIEFEIYVSVYDLENKSKSGYWYDEEDEWIEDEITDEMITSLNENF